MTIKNFTTQYHTLIKQAKVQSTPLTVTILDLCRTVFDAEQTLDPVDFKLFLRHVGLPQVTKGLSPSYTLLSIGKAADTLKPFAQHLPPYVSALKHLQRLDAAALKTLTSCHEIHPLMTSTDAENIVTIHFGRSKRGRKPSAAKTSTPTPKPSASPKPTPPPDEPLDMVRFMVTIADGDDVFLRDFYRALATICGKFHARVSCAPTVAQRISGKAA